MWNSVYPGWFSEEVGFGGRRDEARGEEIAIYYKGLVCGGLEGVHLLKGDVGGVGDTGCENEVVEGLGEAEEGSDAGAINHC